MQTLKSRSAGADYASGNPIDRVLSRLERVMHTLDAMFNALARRAWTPPAWIR